MVMFGVTVTNAVYRPIKNEAATEGWRFRMMRGWISAKTQRRRRSAITPVIASAPAAPGAGTKPTTAVSEPRLSS